MIDEYEIDEVLAMAADYWDSVDRENIPAIANEVNELLRGHDASNEVLAEIALEAFEDACLGAGVRDAEQRFVEHFPTYAVTLGLR